jgi:hypothetical protein
VIKQALLGVLWCGVLRDTTRLVRCTVVWSAACYNKLC